MKKTRNPKLVEDDRWKRKGGPIRPSTSSPKICPNCEGYGVLLSMKLCARCNGGGEIYE